MSQVIVYPNEAGGVALVMPTGELPIEEVAAKDVPAGVPYKIMDAADVPADHTFFNAWVMTDDGVEHNLDRCRAIAHDRRRAARAEEFAPHDDIIAKQIPGADAQAAEDARQEIRDRYAVIQEAINAAASPDEIKAALEVTP